MIPEHPQTSNRHVPLPALLALFVLSGAAGLIYEVVWARQLVLVFGNTSQAVSTILTGFFGGLAIGGAVGGRVADRVARPLRMYGLLELAVVVLVVLTPLSFRLIGEAYRGACPALSGVPLALALVRFVLAILALAPATLLMGATLPTLTRYLTRGSAGLARAFQRLYAANTIGAILGSAVAGFVLIELLGLTGALLAGAVCSATAGTIALVLDRRAEIATPGRRSRATRSRATRSRPQGGRSHPSRPRSRPARRGIAPASRWRPCAHGGAWRWGWRSCQASPRWATRSCGTGSWAPGPAAPRTCSRSSWPCSWWGSRPARCCWAGSGPASGP